MLHTLYARNTQQMGRSVQHNAQQVRNMTTETLSILDLARNKARNSGATQAENLRNKRPDSDPDLLRVVAPDQMPSRPELDAICRRAVADFPNVDPARLRRFLETAEDPAWCSERVARHIARRISEGLITWRPEQ